jgi:hypothetical protein
MISVCTGLLTAMAVMAAPQPQSKKLLDCNTPIGSDQQVVVEQRGQDMVLRELTMSGDWQERSLSREEWKSNGIQLLTDADGTRTILWFTERGKWLESVNDDTNYRETAEADCQ